MILLIIVLLGVFQILLVEMIFKNHKCQHSDCKYCPAQFCLKGYTI